MGSACSIETSRRSSRLSSASVSRTPSNIEVELEHHHAAEENFGPDSTAPQPAVRANAGLECRPPPPSKLQVPPAFGIDTDATASARSSSILPPPPPYLPAARKADLGDRLPAKSEEHGSCISADGVMFSNVKRSSPQLSDGPPPPPEEPLLLPRTSDSDATTDGIRPLDPTDAVACTASVRTDNSAFNSLDDCTSLLEGKRCVRGDFSIDDRAREVSPDVEEATNSSQASHDSEAASVPERLATLSTTLI